MLKKSFFCIECNDYRNTRVEEREQTLSIKGKRITLVVPVRICEKCGEEILDPELDDKTLISFYNEYRKTENLLLPSEIKEIRLQYHLSQSAFSKILGFGEKTITRYENGALQDVCHDNLIRVTRSFDVFIQLWEDRKHTLTKKEQEHIESKLLMNNRKNIRSYYVSTPRYYSGTTNTNYEGDLCNAG